jgi:hypothetical protein
MPGDGVGMFGGGDDDETISPPLTLPEVAADVTRQKLIVIPVELHQVRSGSAPDRSSAHDASRPPEAQSLLIPPVKMNPTTLIIHQGARHLRSLSVA